MSEYDKKNIGLIIGGHGDWFTAKLIRLIRDADLSNRRKLFSVFPDEVRAVNIFHYGVDGAAMLESQWSE